MAKTADSAAAAAPANLSLGQAVMVQAPPGIRLANNESGGYFETNVPTPQTVTPTLLRRLQDGDLLLSA